MITLKDIAREANVTVPTVSRALRGDPEIAPGTKEKITEIAFRLGYKPKRGDTGRLRILGVVIPDMSSFFFTEMLVAIDQELSEKGYLPFYAPYRFDDESCKESFELCKKRNVDGILAICLTQKMADYVRKFITVNAIPVVSVMSPEEQAYHFLDGVRVDITESISEAIRYFLKKGHRRIGLMTDTINYRVRTNEFEEAFRRNGLADGDYKVYLEETRFEDGGFRCMKKALSFGKYPTAFLIGYDHFAIGASRAVREAGKRIPDDIAICSIDNLRMDEYINPALASIGTPTGEMIRTAIRYLRDAMNADHERAVYRTTLGGRLFVRESMG